MGALPRQRLSDLKIQAIKPPLQGQDEYPDDLVIGLRLRIGASGKKVWILRTRAGGKPINLKLSAYPALSVAKAREMARERLQGFAGGELPRGPMTFEDVAKEFIERHAKPRNRTWKNQQWQLDKYILPQWGHKDITELRKRDIIALLDKITDTGATTTANRVLSLVSKIFRWAMGRDLIESNPASGISKPAAETARDRILSNDEISQRWKVAGLLGYPFGTMAKLLMLTGQRLREVSGMKWEDINLIEKTWTLGRQDTKADRKHLVPLSQPVVDILSALPRLMLDDGTESPFVLTTSGKAPISGWSKAKVRCDTLLCAELKIPSDDLEGWTWHDLRRTAATGMARAGILRFIVSRVLNHAETGVTGRHYDYADYAQEKRHALETWASEVLSIVGEGVTGDNVVQMKAGEQ